MHDDGYDIDINGTNFASLYDTVGNGPDMFNNWVSEYNKFDPIQIRHRNERGPASLQFSWTYPTRTCGNVVVPGYSGIINGTSWYSDMTLLGSIPYNITVTCPDGYGQDSATGKCAEVPGNGFRTGSEV